MRTNELPYAVATLCPMGGGDNSITDGAIAGIEIASLPSYIARATPLFTKLDRFGQVAVVADQAWVRMATRLESALLPGISYKTYLPEDRDEALAWVTGASDE